MSSDTALPLLRLADQGILLVTVDIASLPLPFVINGQRVLPPEAQLQPLMMASELLALPMIAFMLLKFVVKSMALDAGQQLYFTPPLIGKILSMIGLAWPEPKHDYKRTPAGERLSDESRVIGLTACLQKRTDFSAYGRKPALYVRRPALQGWPREGRIAFPAEAL